MKQLIIWLAVLVFASVGGLGSAQAQTDGTEIANVPFDFYAGGQKLPAGNYVVDINVETQTITLSDRSRQHTIFLIGVSEGDGDAQSVLVFKHSGNLYALQEVKSDLIDLGFRTKLPEHAVETSMALPQVEVALNRL